MKVKTLQALLHQPASLPEAKEGASWELKSATEMVPCKVEPVIYTSLREILSTKLQNSRPLRCELVSSNSPRTPIKNRLVEQAARAYLQPAVIESNQQENFKSWYWQKLGNCMPIASALKRCWTGAIKLCSSVSSCLQELNWALLNWLKPPKKFH